MLEELVDEQAALLRVLTLVARGAALEAVFTGVVEGVGRLLQADFTAITQYELPHAACVLTAWAPSNVRLPVGDRAPLGGGDVITLVYESGRPARVEQRRDVPESSQAPAITAGLRSSVGAPIRFDGDLWGAVIVGWGTAGPPPRGTEFRLTGFTDLLATAIANADVRPGTQTLADQQAALRRVATLVAQGARPDAVFTAVAEEAAGLLPVTSAAMGRFEPDGTVTTVAAWSGGAVAFPVGVHWDPAGNNVTGLVFSTGRPARLDDFSDASGPIGVHARDAGYRSAVGSPITVEGRLWGVMSAASNAPDPLPADTEARLASFTELVAMAIANTESRSSLARLADEQAALRRVAVLVAQQPSPEDVFSAVTAAVGPLLGADLAAMHLYPGDGTALTIAGWSASGPKIPIGTRLPLAGDSVAARVFRTAAAGRVDRYADGEDEGAEIVHELRLRSSVGAPIIVDGALWGALSAATLGAEPLPADAARRIAAFTELVATAVSNAKAREDVHRLAEEQAALRRVATLVAKEPPPEEVFAQVAEEVVNVLGEVDTSLWRDEGDGTATVVAVSGIAVPVGTRLPTEGDDVIATVLREGRPHWIADNSGRAGTIVEHGRALGIKAAIGCPVVVGGRVWGALGAAGARPDQFSQGTERRITQFADLLATAIANAQARGEIERLAEEQAALRRVATLVAQGAAATAVFDSVAAEVKGVLDAGHVLVCRYEAGAELTLLVAHQGGGAQQAAGTRISHEGDCVEELVRRAERSATKESSEGDRGVIAEMTRAAGLRVSVAAPIVVDGRMWGVITAGWGSDSTPPADTEQRMAKFAQLLGTAIANADSRDQLTASRARLVAAGDEARRRVVRDLHDGAQQRLVHSIILLKQAQRALHDNLGTSESLVADALEQAETSNAELRELSHGILPASLTRGGLRVGISSLISRLDVPVEAHVPAQRFAAEIEATAYFMVAEALTNVVKHAHATSAEVKAAVEDGLLYVEVSDDGIGGAVPTGHGLVGMGDRISALGGQLEVESALNAGTRLVAALPLAAA
ncbi:MAG TPA: GAF domain-containing protein [Solirubrobacteraceae bacterium]|nr:GAF domain-containing protein [Solirubrobacteraceae bacterium]